MDLDEYQAVLVRDVDRVTVRVRGEVDLLTAPHLELTLRKAVLGPPGDLLVDFAAVSFFDAQALGVLAAAASRIRDSDHRLTVLGLSDFQRHLVCLCGLDEALSIQAIVSAVSVAGVEPATLRL